MNRNQQLEMLQDMSSENWDFIVIGGGATGLGTALEAASRGFKTLLLERHDFAKGTSSRSTKLIHGGVRYLQQGNISLVLEALHERGLLIDNAPHLVRHQSFIVPTYDWWEGPFYGIGLKVYDMLAGKLGLRPSKILSREETLEQIPTLEPEGLHGGVIYYDGQFDDSRLAINLAQTLLEAGGTAINYMPVQSLLKSQNVTNGVVATDLESGKEFEIHAAVVVNATGVFTDSILQMDDPDAKPIIAPSQGVHLVLDKSFLPGESAVMVPHTEDGRVLFAVPWRNRVVVGTTDTPIDKPSLEPRPLDEEVEFILKHAAQYLTKDPQRKDVLSAFAGLRPLVRANDEKNTAAISRDHTILTSRSGLVTITGGKWTTYRKMGEDAINHACMVACITPRPSKTETMKIHGWTNHVREDDPLQYYGSDSGHIRRLIQTESELGKKLHANLPYIKAEVIWAVRHEMARTLEDVLARRTRALLLDARASMAIAPDVARMMSAELKKDVDWEKEQLSAYVELAKEYLL